MGYPHSEDVKWHISNAEPRLIQKLRNGKNLTRSRVAMAMSSGLRPRIISGKGKMVKVSYSERLTPGAAWLEYLVVLHAVDNTATKANIEKLEKNLKVFIQSQD